MVCVLGDVVISAESLLPAPCVSFHPFVCVLWCAVLHEQQVVLEADEKSWCTLTAEANNKVLGKRLGKAVAGVKKALAKLDTAALWPLLEVRAYDRLRL